MMQLTRFEMWYGRDERPPEIVRLRAGQLTLDYQEGNLRYVRYAGQELLRCIYVAVRDVNWNTIPGRMTNLAVDSAQDRFRIEFDSFHEAGPLAFRWHACIEGTPQGSIEYTMDGVAESDFRFCRIGFCVLHPIAGIAGSRYRAVTPDGVVSGVLPIAVEPQRMENGVETPMFPPFSSLTVEGSCGIGIATEFEGDLFEMEDQRNWTDGSFKTYCTPLSLGYPHRARAGQAFRQRVIARADLSGQRETTALTDEPKAVALTLGETSGRSLPKIGFGMASHGGDLSDREIALLSKLQPDHLKVEVHFRDASWPACLDRAMATARQLDTLLELTLFLTDEPEEALEILRERILGVQVARVLVFHEAEAPTGTTSPRWMRLVRRHLGAALPDAMFLGGTNGNFAELNRQPPDVSAMDGVCYTVNPQVHASDERSLIEAIEGQGHTVATARSCCGELSISISGVTLKPPFNQAATEEELPQDPNELPAAVDPRQASLFAAAWTVGSVHALASTGAESITYYETTGWRGLLETMAGSPLPERFRSFPGMVYPVYWVFSFLADAKEGTLLESSCDRPLLLAALALREEHRLGVLVANLQPSAQEVHLDSLPDGRASLNRLNEHSMAIAASDPAAFLQLAESLQIQAGKATHVLEPYETAFLQVELS